MLITKDQEAKITAIFIVIVFLSLIVFIISQIFSENETEVFLYKIHDTYKIDQITYEKHFKTN